MTAMKNILLTIILTCGCCLCRQWPKFVKRCSLEDANVNKCLLEAGRSAIPHLTNGVKEWNVPALNPFKHSNMTLNSRIPPLNLTFHISNGIIRDATTTYNLQRINYDKRKNEVHFGGVHKKLRWSGNYILEGTIFGIDLKSKGHFNMECRDMRHSHTAKLLPSRTRKGFSDVKVLFHIHGMNGFKVDLKDNNLPDGILKEVVAVLNENWESVLQILTPTAEQALSRIINEAINPLFRNFQLSEIFPPKKN